MIERPIIIKGGSFSDERGTMRFVNDFRFNDVQRFYLIKHPDPSVVRAWQGHQFEKKYFYPISGSFAIAWVKIDDFKNPSTDLIPNIRFYQQKKVKSYPFPKGMPMV